MSATNQLTDKHQSGMGRRIVRSIFFAALFICLTISACNFQKIDATAETTAKGESNMESKQLATTISNRIPPIDAPVAIETETATFAMG
jgi:hypothetical protein